MKTLLQDVKRYMEAYYDESEIETRLIERMAKAIAEPIWKPIHKVLGRVVLDETKPPFDGKRYLILRRPFYGSLIPTVVRYDSKNKVFDWGENDCEPSQVEYWMEIPERVE
jgi:hypothetical protein